jgi:Big-like domain-containing protein
VSQYQIAMLLVVLAGARTGECRVVTGPDGLCAFGHLEPDHSQLHVGSTLQVRVNGSTCSGRDCVDCGNSGRLRWSSTIPDVASVDSTGLVRARRAGDAQILLGPVGGSTGSPLSMRVEVLPLPN